MMLGLGKGFISALCSDCANFQGLSGKGDGAVFPFRPVRPRGVLNAMSFDWDCGRATGSDMTVCDALDLSAGTCTQQNHPGLFEGNRESDERSNFIKVVFLLTYWQ